MRLVDADAIEKQAYDDLHFHAEIENCEFDLVTHYLDTAKTVDAVPVVRCRHCQSHHWEQEPCHGKPVHYCEKLEAEVTADFFCAAGKRKDGDGNGL